MAGDSEDDIGLADTADSPAPSGDREAEGDGDGDDADGDGEHRDGHGGRDRAAPAGPITHDDSGPALGARPEPDKLARAVARSRVAGLLFANATKQDVKLGRYHLLEMVGAGGMGIVWGAWDPELDRRVAIKLVKATILAARERILAEGQALAKLSHPNVVPVYDVGVVDEQVYIVMEWVRGQTLRAYCRQPRTVPEIVAIYRAAGEGLSAAHRAGLIHRDFKPENAILGDDGRVRVLDFGLARGEVRGAGGADLDGSPSSDLTRGAGTPKYMPPEQAEGKELTPAVDQYAFGVSLRESLAGRSADAKPADIPRWLDEITTRATATESAARYPSMDALLHALARDPATVRRRRLLAAAAVGAAGIAFAVGTLRASGDEVEHCVGGKAEIEKTWNAASRAQLAAHLGSLGPYGAQEATRVGGELARYSAGWAEEHHGACMAQERGELTPQLYERSLGCLTRARSALDAVVGVLSTVENERLPDAVVAARSLPSTQRCVADAVDAQTSNVDPPPPPIAPAAAVVANEIERARILAIAQDPAAAASATAATQRADQLGYRPLIARAQLTLGLASNDRIAAVVVLQRAWEVAFSVGDNAVAVEAYARELYAISLTDHEELPAAAVGVIGAIPMAEAIAKGLGHTGTFARALLYNNIGAFRFQHDDARVWFQRALAEAESLTTGRYELASVWANLALVTTDRDERARLFQRSIAELSRELGADHPQTLDARITTATTRVENLQEAAAQLAEPCDLLGRLHPHLNVKLAGCLFDLGRMLEELGRIEEARVAFARVSVWDDPVSAIIAIFYDVRFAMVAGYTQMFDGKLAEASRIMIALAANLEPKPEFWNQRRAADARVIAAQCELQLGRDAAAIGQLERARATLELVGVTQTLASQRRRVARVEALLAGALARSPLPWDRVAAAFYAETAAAWYRSAGGQPAVLAALDAIVTGSR